MKKANTIQNNIGMSILQRTDPYTRNSRTQLSLWAAFFVAIVENQLLWVVRYIATNPFRWESILCGIVNEKM